MPESKKAKIPQRTNTGNRTGNRYTGGAPRKWRRVRLLEVDAAALDLVVTAYQSTTCSGGLPPQLPPTLRRREPRWHRCLRSMRGMEACCEPGAGSHCMAT